MDNSLKNIFGSLFAPKISSVIGLDVGSSSIKVVQLKKKSGRAVLETYGEIGLGPYGGTDLGRSTVLSAEKLAEVIKDLFREANVTTMDSGMSISIGASFLVFIRIPTTDEKKFADMIPLEARKYIPVPITEVTLDWWAVPKDESTVSEFQNGQAAPEESGTEILLVVIHNDALNKNKEVQKLVGLNASFSEVEIFSSMRVSIEPGLAPQMIMDLGAASTKVFIMERGVLKASHVINRGSQDITISISKSLGIPFAEAEQLKRKQGILEGTENGDVVKISSVTVDYIFAETGRFILGYYKKSNKKISKIVLTGGGSLLKGMKEKAQSAFETPVEVADPFSKVEYPAFLEEVLKTAGPEFAVAIGLAIRRLQGI
ncbi:MAG: type IV pilus assembly protein PilM [Candidatus Paceibacterota bacterium]|jgi:type IV pilus assembly protein PilM